MNLMGIAQYIESRGMGRLGEDIFVTYMPKATGILLMNPYGGTKVDHELPGWRDTYFRIVVRADSYSDGVRKSNQLSAELNIRKDTVMGLGEFRMLMKRIYPINDPLPYRPSDESGIFEFEIEFDCTYILDPLANTVRSN